MKMALKTPHHIYWMTTSPNKVGVGVLTELLPVVNRLINQLLCTDN